MGAYTTYYGVCLQEVEPHYEPGCNYSPEKARIRRGAWLKHSSYADVMVDPTDITKWQAAVDADECIILPELKGTMDGGTPKMGAGFGDQKEVYEGSDFKGSISDRVYKENWPHYRSLVGQSDWHFVYITENYIHITGVPVTIAPKNPISENVEDSVLWQSDISWFEFFTPAPHVMPAGFISLEKTVGTRATALFYNFTTLLAKPATTVFTIYAQQPNNSYLNIGSYTTVSGDTVQATLAAHLNSAINTGSGTHGYSSALATDTNPNDSFLVTAKEGLGATVNGKELSVEFSGGGVQVFFTGGA